MIRQDELVGKLKLQVAFRGEKTEVQRSQGDFKGVVDRCVQWIF